MSAPELTPAQRAELYAQLNLALSGVPDRNGDRLLIALDELERAAVLAILAAADPKPDGESSQA